MPLAAVYRKYIMTAPVVDCHLPISTQHFGSLCGVTIVAATTEDETRSKRDDILWTVPESGIGQL